MSPVKIALWVLCMAALSGCIPTKDKPATIGAPMDWSELPGWEEDAHAEVWPALVNNCKAVSDTTEWASICSQITGLDAPNDTQAREFIEHWFQPHTLYARGGKEQGLITGYYEPLLFGSLEPDERYRYPLYQQPESLLTIHLGDVYPDLKDRRLRGQLRGDRIVPFYSREEIESNRALLAGNELIWLDNRDDVFFLHIQGSGRIQLPDGTLLGAGYSNQNGHPYVPIGRILLQDGELAREEISLFTIRQWLDDNPGKAESLLNRNPSYVFFVLRNNPENGPIGSLNVPLTPERSIAIDPKLVKLGTPMWLMTNYPGNPGKQYNRLVVAQDTGGAIKGTLRADLFWGYGEDAERAAGNMKEPVRLIVLQPRKAGSDRAKN